MPGMEGLESRMLLSTIDWDSANHPSGGDWDTASNWVGDLVPGTGDEALIEGLTNGIVTHDHAYDDEVGQITSDGTATLEISAGSLAIDSSSNLGNLNLHGGTLTISGTLTIAAQMTWLDGIVEGSGELDTYGTLTMGETSAAAREWLVGVTLKNYANATLASGDSAYGLLLVNNAIFWNEPQGIFTLATDATIDTDQTAPSFLNEGTFTKPAADAGTSTIGVAFDQSYSGRTEVDAGTLQLLGGGGSGASGADSGKITAAAGTTLRFGGDFSWDSSSVLSSSGTVDFDGAMLSDAGSYEASAGTSVDGSQVELTGTVVGLGSGLSISYGSLELSTGQTLRVPVLDLGMGGTLEGTDDLTVTEQTTWLDGAIDGPGTVRTYGALTMGAGDLPAREDLIGATLDNYAAATLATDGGYGLVLQADAVFDNEAGASVTLSIDTPITIDQSSPTFINEGTFTKPADDAGTSSIHATFDQTATGITLVNAGTLQLDGGGSVTSSITAVAGTTLVLGGTFAFDASSAIVSAGSVDFDEAMLSDAGSYEASAGTSVDGSQVELTGTVISLGSGLAFSYGSLELSTGQSLSVPVLDLGIGGALEGTDDLTVTEQTTWLDGAIDGPGTVRTYGTLTMGADDLPAREDLIGATLDNYAAATLATDGGYGLVLQADAVFDNEAGASVTLSTDTPIIIDQSSPTFINEGTFTKPADDAGTSSIHATFDQTATGVLSVQGGALVLDSGETIEGIVAVTGGSSLTMAIPTNLSPTGTLSGGYWSVGADSSLSLGGDITTNDSSISVNGANATFVGLSSLNTNAASGGLAISDGASLTLEGSLDNRGSIALGSGLLTVDGSYTQETMASLKVGIDGTTPISQFGRLSVSATASIGGSSLIINLQDGFEPTVGQTFAIINAKALIGQFGSVNQSGVSGPIVFQTTYSSGSVTLVATVAPINVTKDLSVKAGGFVFNRTTRQFSQTLTITNISSTPLTGPLELVLLNLKNATLLNQSGTYQGNPYITILGSDSLGVGQSLTFTLIFADPTLATISYTPEFFMGPIPPQN